MFIKFSIFVVFLFASMFVVHAQQLIDCSDFVYYTHSIKPNSFVKPEYPAAAKTVRASGKVSVRVLIDENGNVAEAQAITGHPLLRAASVRAALQTKFFPIILSQKKISCYVVLDYNFVADEFQPKENPKSVNRSKTIVDLYGGTITGKAVELSRPPFPTNCRCKFSKNLKTVVQFTVDEKGNVESAVGISGHPMLRAMSIAAIRNSKFVPSFIDNSPVKAYGTIIYDFAKRKTRIVKYELKLER